MSYSHCEIRIGNYVGVFVDGKGAERVEQLAASGIIFEEDCTDGARVWRTTVVKGGHFAQLSVHEGFSGSLMSRSPSDVEVLAFGNDADFVRNRLIDVLRLAPIQTQPMTAERYSEVYANVKNLMAERINGYP